MTRIALVAWLCLACAPVRAETLQEAVGALQSRAQTMISQVQAQSANVTWGQTQALEDLGRLAEVAGQIRSSLSGPEATPAALHPSRDALGVALSRLKTTLPLSGLSEAEPLLSKASSVVERLRALEYRFDGRAQPRGERLAATPMEGSAELLYADPRELLSEARNVRYSAESLGRGRMFPPFGRAWPGASGYESLELIELVRAAHDFEMACSVHYQDVHETAAEFRRLQRAYDRAHGSYLWSNHFAYAQLERAVDRLSQFYAALP